MSRASSLELSSSSRNNLSFQLLRLRGTIFQFLFPQPLLFLIFSEFSFFLCSNYVTNFLFLFLLNGFHNSLLFLLFFLVTVSVPSVLDIIVLVLTLPLVILDRGRQLFVGIFRLKLIVVPISHD